MSEVFLAQRLGPAGFRKQLVLKRLLPKFANKRTRVERFLREAQVAALIEHPNIAHVYDFGIFESQFYIVMEFVDGLTLAEVLGLMGPLEPGVACRILIDVLDALEVVHTAKDLDGRAMMLVHRDVTPRNVMVSRHGSVKLIDFGIAISGRDAASPSAGTKYFQSPEQLLNSGIDRRSDIYSSGMVLKMALEGRKGLETTEVSRTLPVSLVQILERALAKRREDRFGSARMFQAELEAFIVSCGLGATRSRLAEIAAEHMPLTGFTGRLQYPEATGLNSTYSASSDDGANEVAPSVVLSASVDADPISRPLRLVIPAFVLVIGFVLLAAFLWRSAVPMNSPVAETSAPVAAVVPSIKSNPVAPTRPDASVEPSAKGARVQSPTVPHTASKATSKDAPALVGEAEAVRRRNPKVGRRQARRSLARKRSGSASTSAPKEPQIAAKASTSRGAAKASAPRDAAKAPVPRDAAKAPASAPVNRVLRPVSVVIRKSDRPTQERNIGFLSVDTKPWTKVYLDGESVDFTPIAHMRMASGVHTLRLSNPDESVDHIRKIKIEPAKDLAIRIQFAGCVDKEGCSGQE